jgi:hypothetical protein
MPVPPAGVEYDDNTPGRDDLTLVKSADSDHCTMSCTAPGSESVQETMIFPVSFEKLTKI